MTDIRTVLIAAACAAACGRGVGEPCDRTSDCEDSLVCVDIRGEKECRKNWGLEGQECHDGECQPEFSCVSKNDNTCMLTKLASEACYWNAECTDPLVCNWSAGYVCVSSSQQGEACEVDSDCSPGLTCLHSGTGADGVCAKGCTADFQCASGFVCVEKAGNLCMKEKTSGQACHWNQECATGLVCNWTTNPSKCVPPGDHGAPCSMDNECATGYTCVMEGPAGECRIPCSSDAECPAQEVCVAKAGGLCFPEKPLGATCQWNDECADGLVCNWARDPHSCIPPGGPGDICEMDNECEAGLLCNPWAEPRACDTLCGLDHPCIETQVCVKEAGAWCLDMKGPGEQCFFEQQCLAGLGCDVSQTPRVCAPHCVTDSDCDAGETCVAEANFWCLVLMNEGEPCVAHGGCVEGLVCNMANSPAVCIAPGPSGTHCTVDGDCQPDLQCIPALFPYTGTGSCSLPVGPGAACWSTQHCNPDLFCLFGLYPSAPELGVCSLKKTEFEPCAADEECESGLHCDETTKECTSD